MGVNGKKKSKVVYFMIAENGNSLSMKGTCGKYDFEHEVEIEDFPSEKERDEAYRVWGITFIFLTINNKLK